jgi:3-oxoacyl-[acyl-carrier-protein] synthase-3
MIFIHGIGHFHPNNIIDNQFLTDLNIGTSNEWIMDRVGIQERRTVLSLDYIKNTYNKNPTPIGSHLEFSNAQTGALAAKNALTHANLLPKDIGMVISGSCLSQYSLPAEACMIAAELGINAPSFDINSACSTFAIHMNIINLMQADNLPDYVLLVVPENITRAIDFTDRKSAVLFGDGSTALIVSKKHKSNTYISHTIMESNPGGWKTITIPTGGHFYQEGSVVQRFAIKKTLATIEKLQKKSNIQHNNYYFIGHQANLTMLRSVCKLTSISEDRHLYNVDKFGNCGAAGAPSVLSQNWTHFKSGDQIILAVVGAGLTWGGMVIERG